MVGPWVKLLAAPNERQAATPPPFSWPLFFTPNRRAHLFLSARRAASGVVGSSLVVAVYFDLRANMKKDNESR